MFCSDLASENANSLNVMYVIDKLSSIISRHFRCVMDRVFYTMFILNIIMYNNVACNVAYIMYFYIYYCSIIALIIVALIRDGFIQLKTCFYLFLIP